MDDQLYRDVLSGRRGGAAARVLRAGLRAASLPYSLAVRLRNRAFDLGVRRAHRVEVPVVSVGNLTLGGTGKTPLVEYLARWFRAAGLRVCILSRGYGAADGAANDEARVLAENLPGVPHLQGRDRVALAHGAIDVHHAEVLLLDDGFQHRRLARDLDIVVLDALDPLGGNRLFPRGLLREPVSSLRRADLVVLNRADLLTPRQRQQIHDHCVAAARRDHTGTLPWIEIVQRPCGLIGKRAGATAGLPSSAFAGDRDCTSGSANSTAAAPGATGLPSIALVGDRDSISGSTNLPAAAPGATAGLPSSAFAGDRDCTSGSANSTAAAPGATGLPSSAEARRVAAFCGIGNPAGFRRTLESLGWHVVAFRTFADHHAYTPADVASLSTWSVALDVEAVVTTQKDLVKLDAPTLGGVPLVALAIDVAVLHGADLLERRLAALVGSQRVEAPPSQAAGVSSQRVDAPTTQAAHHRPHATPKRTTNPLDSSAP